MRSAIIHLILVVVLASTVSAREYLDCSKDRNISISNIVVKIDKTNSKEGRPSNTVIKLITKSKTVLCGVDAKGEDVDKGKDFNKFTLYQCRDRKFIIELSVVHFNRTGLIAHSLDINADVEATERTFKVLISRKCKNGYHPWGTALLETMCLRYTRESTNELCVTSEAALTKDHRSKVNSDTGYSDADLIYYAHEDENHPMDEPLKENGGRDPNEGFNSVGVQIAIISNPATMLAALSGHFGLVSKDDEKFSATVRKKIFPIVEPPEDSFSRDKKSSTSPEIPPHNSRKLVDGSSLKDSRPRPDPAADDPAKQVDAPKPAASQSSNDTRIWAERDGDKKYEQCLKVFPDNPCVREIFHLKGSADRVKSGCMTGDLQTESIVWPGEANFPTDLFPGKPQCYTERTNYAIGQRELVMTKEKHYGPICEQCVLPTALTTAESTSDPEYYRCRKKLDNHSCVRALFEFYGGASKLREACHKDLKEVFGIFLNSARDSFAKDKFPFGPMCGAPFGTRSEGWVFTKDKGWGDICDKCFTEGIGKSATKWLNPVHPLTGESALSAKYMRVGLP